LIGQSPHVLMYSIPDPFSKIIQQSATFA